MRSLKLSVSLSMMMGFSIFQMDMASAQQESSPEATNNSEPESEKEIRAQIDSYVQAFNRADAEAVAKHWSKDGELLLSDGSLLQGYDAIKSGFEKYFSNAGAAKIELLDPEIEILSPNIARESGTARVVSAEQEPSETTYEALYIKTSQGWQLDAVREQAIESPSATHYEQLKSLEWMVGDWVDDSSESQVQMTCRWTTNRNFMVRSFQANLQEQDTFEGTQVIGWDPSTQRIRSWLFDSDGGFGTGVWSSNDEGGWTVHTLNILPDGLRASATHLYTKVDEGAFEFRSIGRQVDGQLLPSIDPIRMVRHGALQPNP